MPVANGDFDTVGAAHFGLADSWTVTDAGAEEEYAEFFRDAAETASEAIGEEVFEGWGETVLEFGEFFDDIEPVVFFRPDGGVQAVDDFEDLWPTSGSIRTNPGTLHVWDSTRDAEDFEDGWGTTATGETFASFDTAPEDHEDFEEDWGQAVILAFTLRDFDIEFGVTGDREPFEAVYPPQDATVNIATDRVICIGHGYVDGEKVQFNTSVGTLPGGLQRNIVYFVINAVADNIQVALTSGGSAVDITSEGTGSLQLRAAPDGRWPDLL